MSQQEVFVEVCNMNMNMLGMRALLFDDYSIDTSR